MNGGENTFTTKEILLRMEAKVDAILADHETRIRLLERLKNAIPSVSVLSLLVSVAAIYLTVR